MMKQPPKLVATSAAVVKQRNLPTRFATVGRLEPDHDRDQGCGLVGAQIGPPKGAQRSGCAWRSVVADGQAIVLAVRLGLSLARYSHAGGVCPDIADSGVSTGRALVVRRIAVVAAGRRDCST